MNMQKYRLTSKIDDNDMIEIEIDLDTIDDYKTDHLFLQCCWDMASEPRIPKLERVKYWIELMG